MRSWSIDPKYLDTKGLVALWRECLLAKKVLESKTKGDKHHPQLFRFLQCKKPNIQINQYLHFVCDEADERGYSFNRLKLSRRTRSIIKIPVSSGQIEYEWKHLMTKLFKRDRKRYFLLKKEMKYSTNNLFQPYNGEIEDWEVIK